MDSIIGSDPFPSLTSRGGGGGETRGKNPSLNEPEGVASRRAWQEANSDLRVPSDGCMKHPSLSKKGNVFIEAANTKEEIAQVAFPLRHQRIRRLADDPECKRMTPRSSLRPHTRVGMAGPTAEGVPRCSVRRDPKGRDGCEPSAPGTVRSLCWRSRAFRYGCAGLPYRRVRVG